VHSGANHHRPLFQRRPRRHVNLAIFRVSHHSVQRSSLRIRNVRQPRLSMSQ
jgi:hypothetical protein